MEPERLAKISQHPLVNLGDYGRVTTVDLHDKNGDLEAYRRDIADKAVAEAAPRLRAEGYADGYYKGYVDKADEDRWKIIKAFFVGALATVTAELICKKIKQNIEKRCKKRDNDLYQQKVTKEPSNANSEKIANTTPSVDGEESDDASLTNRC